MSVALGLVLAAGMVLVAASVMTPRRVSVPSAGARLVRDRLAQAGLGRVSPALVAAVCTVLGAGAGFSVKALLGVTPLAVAAGIVAATVPLVMIGARARARQRANRLVWPDVVDQLVSAVRSGLGLPKSVAVLGAVGPEATRSAFAEFDRVYGSTGNFSVAIDVLKAQLADPVADRILETLRMAREVGGTELVSVLRTLGAHVRQEAAIRSEIAARQSWVVGAARLGIASPWVVLVLLSTRPEAAAAYNSPDGVALVVGGLGASLVAYRLMLRLGRVPDERRWFA